jgi:phage baseplate assembly protein W
MTTHIEQAIFEALADRLGEHPRARNYEIADSGEYETKLDGPIDVEMLAEWLVPTVLAARPEPPVTDAEVLSALNAYEPRFASDNLADYAEDHAGDMRAALEAARATREGKP